MEMTVDTSLTLAESLNQISQELYSFLSSVQKPALSDPRWAQLSRERCQALSQRVAELRDKVSERQRELGAALEKLYQYLMAFYNELTSSSANPSLARIREISTSLGHTYEEIFTEYRHLRDQSALHLPRLKQLKPANYARNVFHVLNGVVGAVLYQFFLTRHQALTILMVLLAAATVTEVSRRFSKRWNDFLVDRVFGMISRPRERFEVNSATYYLGALTLITYFFPKEAIEAGLLVLALGDPAATLVGRRWGKLKLWRDRSWAGSAAFFFTAFVVSYAYFTLAVPSLSGVGLRALAAVSIALTGALAELLSVRLDDNFTVPILCSWVAYLWL